MLILHVQTRIHKRFLKQNGMRLDPYSRLRHLVCMLPSIADLAACLVNPQERGSGPSQGRLILSGFGSHSLSVTAGPTALGSAAVSEELLSRIEAVLATRAVTWQERQLPRLLKASLRCTRSKMFISRIFLNVESYPNVRTSQTTVEGDGAAKENVLCP